MPARAPLSLKMQAIGFLSRREYSRQELRAKLLSAVRRRERAAQDAAAASDAGRGRDSDREVHPHARRDADRKVDPHASRDADRKVDHEPDHEPDREVDRDPEHEVDELLDWLQAHAYLSDARFVESRVHARAARQGLARIRQELARHGVALPSEQAAALRETEFARAQAVWQRKFGTPASDARGRAAQARFLVARGFAAEIVRRIVGGQDEF